MNREKIEIRIVNGQHLAYYKGELLPFLSKSTVIQDANIEKYATAVLEFEVELQENNTLSFQITGEKLCGAIKNNDSDGNNSI